MTRQGAVLDPPVETDTPAEPSKTETAETPAMHGQTKTHHFELTSPTAMRRLLLAIFAVGFIVAQTTTAAGDFLRRVSHLLFP